jgi:hypothetical protein
MAMYVRKQSTCDPCKEQKPPQKKCKQSNREKNGSSGTLNRMTSTTQPVIYRVRRHRQYVAMAEPPS